MTMDTDSNDYEDRYVPWQVTVEGEEAEEENGQEGGLSSASTSQAAEPDTDPRNGGDGSGKFLTDERLNEAVKEAMKKAPDFDPLEKLDTDKVESLCQHAEDIGQEMGEAIGLSFEALKADPDTIPKEVTQAAQAIQEAGREKQIMAVLTLNSKADETLTSLTAYLLDFIRDALRPDFLQAIFPDAKTGEVHEALHKAEKVLDAMQTQTTRQKPRHLDTKIPDSLTMPTSKLAKPGIMSLLINSGPASVVVSKRAKSTVTTPVDITLVSVDGVKLDGNYTEYDALIQGAVISLSKTNQKFFTRETLYKTITQSDPSHCSEKALEEVERSIEKQRRIHASCDMTQIVNQKGYDCDAATVGGFLLNVEDATVESGGRIMKGYEIIKEPLLYEYSKRIGNQITTFPAELLDVKETYTTDRGKLLLTGKSKANTRERLSIKGYLLQRIAAMKSDEERAQASHKIYQKNVERLRKKGEETGAERTLASFRRISRTINLSSVYEEADVPQRNRVRYEEYIFLCLDNWKIRGYIKAYSKVRGRGKKSYEKVRITV